ncbi:MAG: hypothetical protein FP814_15185 [Desulfobacterium sp.]|nr:hypothetical protein [Desulfobacterium sp.]MBU3950248.1 zinc-ribbon domain containing protein [Pseudomonadota bacterium]MBU4011090.1 zinc-ribbon domain containing protein [Pseudomonadota bacterium]MBU4035007.1 zinc-ribbon domain containing protein [Pseudomonadota bacterium]
MQKPFGVRDRGTKDKKATMQNQKAKVEKRFKRHPLFGEIPMLKMNTSHNSEYWDYDPDYNPSLPVGAVRGNVKSQSFCRMCHVPRYFFINEDKTCVQCGQDFVFSAKEQKYWFESLKFHFDSTAIRCPKCRKLRRSVKALNAQLEITKYKLRQEPNNPSLMLSLAQTIVAFHKRTSSGNLNEAIASCRQAIKLWPSVLEAFYWEGKCHLQAGRHKKADDLFNLFIENAAGRGKYSTLVRKAGLHIKQNKVQQGSPVHSNGRATE